MSIEQGKAGVRPHITVVGASSPSGIRLRGGEGPGIPPGRASRYGRTILACAMCLSAAILFVVSTASALAAPMFVDYGNGTFDTNGDGRIDLTLMDRDGDGLIDKAGFDVNANGIYDVYAHDNDENGHFEGFDFDLDETGVNEALGWDDNGNGILDRFNLDPEEDAILVEFLDRDENGFADAPTGLSQAEIDLRHRLSLMVVTGTFAGLSGRTPCEVWMPDSAAACVRERQESGRE